MNRSAYVGFILSGVTKNWLVLALYLSISIHNNISIWKWYSVTLLLLLARYRNKRLNSRKMENLLIVPSVLIIIPFPFIALCQWLQYANYMENYILWGELQFCEFTVLFILNVKWNPILAKYFDTCARHFKVFNFGNVIG